MSFGRSGFGSMSRRGLPGFTGRGAGAKPFDPASLFGASDKGFTFDFTQQSSLWADTGGTTPIVDGGTIKRADDLSGKGNHALESVTNSFLSGPTWTGGVAHGDGSKGMATPSIDLTGTDKATLIALVRTNTVANAPVIYQGNPFVAGYFGISASSVDVSGGSFVGQLVGTSSAINTRAKLDGEWRVVTLVVDAASANDGHLRVNGAVTGEFAGGDMGVSALLNNQFGLFGRYSGNSPFTGDIARAFLIGRELTADELFEVERWAGKGFMAVKPEIPAAGQADVTAFISYGQSRSTGSYGNPVVSTASQGDYMWTGDNFVRARTGTNQQFNGWQNHIEGQRDAPNGEGETVSYGAFQMLRQQGRGGAYFADAPGIGETEISDLGKTANTYYAVMMNDGQKASVIARDQRQLSYKVGAILWQHGESVSSPGTYAADLKQLRSDASADFKAGTLQTDDVWLITDQCDRADVSIAVLAAMDSDSKLVVSHPLYFLPHYDDVHLANGATAKVSGAYFGLALHRRYFGADPAWQPLRILSAVVTGGTVRLTYNKSGLAFDTSLVAAQANSGFRLYQSDGTTARTITGATIEGGNTVVLACAAATAGDIVRVGFSNPADHSIAGVKTNLRDSQGDSIVFDPGGLAYPMHNWAVGEQVIAG